MDRTILLVEDDPSLATVLPRILRRLDAAVEQVGSGREALTRIGQGGIDLVVLDLGLPDMDGTDVCRLARKGGFTGPVLVLTARHGPAPRELALSAGADGYLTKPFTIHGLLGRLAPLLPDRDPVSGPGAL